MRRCLVYLLLGGMVVSGLACPPAPPPTTPGEPAKKYNASTVEPKVPAPENLSDLKSRIQAAIDQVENRTMLTTYPFWTIFHGILGMGPDRAMLTDEKTGKKVNALKYICEGGQINGMQFLPTKDGLDVRTAMGIQEEGVFQGHQDQFVAEMAQWGTPRDRTFRVGGRDFTFQDFIRHSTARTSVTQNQELSWAILIVSQYYGTEYAWTNNRDEKLRFEDVVRYELDQPIEGGADGNPRPAACGGTHRLFGLTWAYHLHLRNGGKKEGVWKDAEAKLDHYKKRAKELQNSDGTFSTDYFKGRDNKQDSQLRIGTTGHTVEWLSLVMTDEELRAPWMQDAVSALAVLILNMRDESIDSGGLYHATHGLHLYYDRVFGTPAPYLPLPPKR